MTSSLYRRLHSREKQWYEMIREVWESRTGAARLSRKAPITRQLSATVKLPSPLLCSRTCTQYAPLQARFADPDSLVTNWTRSPWSNKQQDVENCSANISALDVLWYMCYNFGRACSYPYNSTRLLSVIAHIVPIGHNSFVLLTAHNRIRTEQHLAYDILCLDFEHCVFRLILYVYYYDYFSIKSIHFFSVCKKIWSC